MWDLAKRIAHALVWLAILLIPAGVMVAILESSGESAGAEVGSLAVLLLILAVATVVEICAVRRRWPLTWPLLVLFVLTWPFGVSVPLVVGLIGLGKLAVHAIGRGSAASASELTAPVVAARPRGLVESGNHE